MEEMVMMFGISPFWWSQAMTPDLEAKHSPTHTFWLEASAGGLLLRPLQSPLFYRSCFFLNFDPFHLFGPHSGLVVGRRSHWNRIKSPSPFPGFALAVNTEI
jgi:hypothetical protein